MFNVLWCDASSTYYIYIYMDIHYWTLYNINGKMLYEEILAQPKSVTQLVILLLVSICCLR